MTLETKVEIFNTIQLFRPIGIHQWYPACDLSAGVSKTILDWFAASRSQEFFVSNCKNKKSYLWPLDSDSFHVICPRWYWHRLVTRIAHGPDRSAAC